MKAKRRGWTAGGAVFMVLAMHGLAFAAVPAYRAFCQTFGFAGTPVRAVAAPDTVADQTITIRFNSDTDPGLPWRFKPVQRSMDLRVGETGLAFYQARNLDDRDWTGTATFNVTPLKAAPYFNKIACFCFTRQTLAAGETVDMPVTFFVDPAILEDDNVRDVAAVTLSYTFFPDPDAVPPAHPGS